MSQLNTVNGYPVIQQRAFSARPGCRDGRVILVDRGGNREGQQRYVVAVQYRGDFAGDGGRWDREWDHGEYLDGLANAARAFEARVARRCS